MKTIQIKAHTHMKINILTMLTQNFVSRKAAGKRIFKIKRFGKFKKIVKEIIKLN